MVKHHLKLLYVLGTMLIVIVLLVGCKTSLIDRNKISEDLVGYKLSFGATLYEVGKPEEIQEIKILSRETNKREKMDVVEVFLEVSNDDLTAEGEFSFQYRYEPNSGWVLNRILNQNGSNNKVKLNREISVEEISESLYDMDLVLESNSNSLRWGLNKDNIEQVSIASINPGSNAFQIIADVNISSANESARVMATLKIQYEFIPQSSWELQKMELVTYEKKLYAGVSSQLIKNALHNQRIRDIFTEGNSVSVYSYEWEIEDASQIKEVQIINQQTDLEKFNDQLDIKVTMEHENLSVQGNLKMEYTYHESQGWVMQQLSKLDDRPFEYTYISKPDISQEKISLDIVNQNFPLTSGWFGSHWTIEAGETKNLKVVGSRPLKYGTGIEYEAHLILYSTDRIVEGNLLIEYQFNNGEWTFTQIKLAKDFQEISEEVYKSLE